MKRGAYEKLLKSIDQARTIHAGKRKASRVYDVKPMDIKAIRHKWRVSQTEFADLIGVSPATLKNWEQGRTYPDGAARILLKVAENRLDAIREALK
jgi:putative transcriptional regulator